MKARYSALLACIGCAPVGFVTIAQAQDATSSDDESILEEVIVTAQKRSSKLQEVPTAVTALTDERRELIGLQTIEDMTNFVPGLFYDNGLDRANIRGIGRVTNAPGSDPGVAIYVNGFYQSSTVSVGRSSIFNNRVEVLRGPQGTLYGRNASGGAINTVSRMPNDTMGGEFRMTYANYDRRVFEGTFTSPITDWLQFRSTASVTKQDGGYFENIAPGFPDDGGQADNHDYDIVFAGNIGTAADFSLRAGYSDYHTGNRLSAVYTPYATNINCSAATPTACNLLNSTFGTAAITFATYGSGGPSSLYNTTTGNILPPANPQYLVTNPANPNNKRAININTPSTANQHGSTSVVSNFVYHLSGADLKWIGGYNQYSYDQYSDFDNSAREGYEYTPPNGQNTVSITTRPVTRFAEDKSYWSNELNLTSTASGPLQWLVGAYQYHEKYFQIPSSVRSATFNLPVYARPTALPVGNGAVAIYDSWTTLVAPNDENAFNFSSTRVEVNSYALFSQFDWTFIPKWTATIGARYSWDMKEGWEYRRNIMWDPTWAGSRAKAFDNSPPLDCYNVEGETDPTNPNQQLTRNAANDQPTAVTNCRYRDVDQREWKDWSGTLGLNWKPTDTTMTYVKYDRGYKSGAIRLGSFSPDAEVDSEQINAYELGAKTDITNRLQVNASTFYYDYRNYQFPLTFRDENNNTRQEYWNIPRSESYGVELETTWVPLNELTLLLNYSYLHTEVKSDIYVLDTFDRQATGPEASKDVRPVANLTQPGGFDYYQNARGGKLPASPEHKWTANATYNWTFSAGSLIPSFTYSWRDRVSNSTGLLSRKTTNTPSYGTADARVTWMDTHDRYSVIAYVRNAFDDETYNSTFASTINGEVVQSYNLNPPRTFGMEIQYRFGSESR